MRAMARTSSLKTAPVVKHFVLDFLLNIDLLFLPLLLPCEAIVQHSFLLHVHIHKSKPVFQIVTQQNEAAYNSSAYECKRAVHQLGKP